MSEGEGLAPPQHADDVILSADHEQDVDENGEGVADLSLCDASFCAKDSVPTSDHDRISKCTEGVRLLIFDCTLFKFTIFGSNSRFQVLMKIFSDQLCVLG